MVVEKKAAFLLLFAAIFAAVQGHREGELCLSAPRAEVNIYVVVRGEQDHLDICGSRHFMRYLKRAIRHDFNKTSGDKCHFKLDSYASCDELNLGAVPRTAVTFTTNLTCGDRCFKHTDNLTSIMEINRQDDLINEALKTTEKTELKYNKTDVIIRYFSGDKGPVIYPCKETSHVLVIDKRDHTLCECPRECKQDVIFSFRQPVYNFFEGSKEVTIHVDKITGSIDENITLTISSYVEGEQTSKTITFDPKETKKAITFNVTDNDIALEPTKQYELFLEGTHRKYNLLFKRNNKTTINILDDEELVIGLDRNVTVMEGNSATLCVDFNYKFATNFSINVVLTNQTFDDPAAPGEDFYLSDSSIEAIPTEQGPNNSLCFNISSIEDKFSEDEECYEVGINLKNSLTGRLMVEIEGGKDTATVCIQDDDRKELCLATPRTEITIHVIVRGETADMDICGSQHLMRFLKRTIYRDFEETSKEECHFSLDDYASCANLPVGVVPRTAITFKTDLTCGNECFKHTDLQTSIMELNRQYEGFNQTMNIFRVKELEYNQTDVIVRYFYEETGPVVYDCKEASHEYVIGEGNLTLCKCQKKCLEPQIGVVIGFEKPEVQVPEDITNGVKLLCVKVLDGTLIRETVLSVSYQNKSAIDGQDYESRPINLTLSQDDTQVCFNVSILDDEVDEPQEYFFVTITTEEPHIKLSPNTTTLTIEEDCPAGKVFLTCGSACPPTCDDSRPFCIFKCVRGCFCPHDTVEYNGKCIYREQCPIRDEYCLATPRSEVTFHAIVRGDTANIDMCSSQHLMNYLRETIYLDFKKTSKRKCHFKLDSYSSCDKIKLGDVPRIAITFKTNLTCGDECFKHTDNQTSIMEINRQYEIFNKSITVKEFEYNKTDVIIRYFYGEKSPVVYDCKDTSLVRVIQDRSLTLCNCPRTCMRSGRELLIGLTQNVTVMESKNATLCVYFKSYFTTKFSINVVHLQTDLNLDDPATPLEDFNPSNFSIEAIPNVHGPDNNLCFNVHVMQDEYVEYEECFEVGISLPDSVHSGPEINEDNSTVVCIKDDDSVEIGFEDTEVQVPEDITDGVKLLCVKVMEGELKREATVIVQYYDITTVADEDYKKEIVILTFSPDDDQKCFNVSIIDDSIQEEDEVFFANITTSDPQIILSQPMANLTIDGKELCLATPRTEVTFNVIVRGNTNDMDMCGSQHFMDSLKEEILSDFKEEGCHFKLDSYSSCGEIMLGEVPRIEIILESNLICGNECFIHSDNQNSIKEFNRQHDHIDKTMDIFQRNVYKYNQTDVIMRYFHGEENPIFYACKETSLVIQDKDLKLCTCPKTCLKPKKA